MNTADPIEPTKEQVAAESMEKFWLFVDKNGPKAPRGLPGRCWMWRGWVTNGYGRLYLGERKAIRAHRYAHQLMIGPIPEGLTVDHLCRNKRCVNPKHLEAVTNRENVLRGSGPTAVNHRKKTCKRGHHNWGIKKIDGARECLTCKNMWNRNARAALHSPEPPQEGAAHG